MTKETRANCPNTVITPFIPIIKNYQHETLHSTPNTKKYKKNPTLYQKGFFFSNLLKI